MSIIRVTFLSICACFGCKNSEESLTSSLVLVGTSTHYSYYQSINDDTPLDTLWMEQHYEWATNALSITSKNKLNFFKYLNRDHLRKLTGRDTDGYAEVGSWDFHSIWHPEGHENIHTLVINSYGHPPLIFTEGIAVALNPQPIYGFGIFLGKPTWNGRDIDAISMEFIKNNKLPELYILLDNRSFRKLELNLTYPISGSFVKFLLSNYPIEKIKVLFQSIPFDSSISRIEMEFQQIFSEPIQSVWDNWQKQILN